MLGRFVLNDTATPNWKLLVWSVWLGGFWTDCFRQVVVLSTLQVILLGPEDGGCVKKEDSKYRDHHSTGPGPTYHQHISPNLAQCTTCIQICSANILLTGQPSVSAAVEHASVVTMEAGCTALCNSLITIFVLPLNPPV